MFQMVAHFFHNKPKYGHVLLVGALLAVWVLFHTGSITYGTQHVPLHTSYIGDEQAPVYGALFMLKDMNPLGLRNEHAVYYGPLLSMIAVPAIVSDLGTKVLLREVNSPTDYRDAILWDWGGVVVFLRITAALISFLGVLAMFLLFRTRTLNPSGARLIPWIASGLLASNYLYFAYGALFKHWVVVVTILLWQLYCVLMLYERTEGRRVYWVASIILGVVSFGVSYLPVMYHVMWVPLAVTWIVRRDMARIKEFVWAGLAYVIGCILVVWWHPYAFIRMLGMVGIGEPLDQLGAILDVTTVVGSTNSFLPYAFVILSSLHLLLVAVVLVVYRLPRGWWRGQLWVPVILAPALVHYVIFSIPTQHVSRYMLPTTTLLLVFGVALFAHLYAHNNRQILGFRFVVAMTILATMLNLYYVIGRERMMFAGPPDTHMIARILAWQEKDATTRTLVVQHGPLGHPHTKEAYQKFLTEDERRMTTWSQLLASPAPTNVPALNVEYLRDRDQYSAESATTFNHVVRLDLAPLKEGTMDTRGDVFDVMPWRVWSFEQYRNRYTILK